MVQSALIVVVAFLSLLIPRRVQAQEPRENLRVQISVIDPQTDGQFAAQELKDAATVLLTAKAPDIIVADSASLQLWVAPTCLTESRGHACRLVVHLAIPMSAWEQPFGQPVSLTLWSSGSVMMGPLGSALSQMRQAMDTDFDQLVAAWRRLPEDQRACWLKFSNGRLREPFEVTQRSIGAAGDSMVVADAATVALFFGPCSTLVPLDGR